jgi:hypothetical protein
MRILAAFLVCFSVLALNTTYTYGMVQDAPPSCAGIPNISPGLLQSAGAPSAAFSIATYESVQQSSGFKPLRPSYVPQGYCLAARWVRAAPKPTVVFSYQAIIDQGAFSISQERGSVTFDQSFYPADSIQTIPLDQGQATYIGLGRGTYHNFQGSTSPITRWDPAHYLLFERGGLFVRISDSVQSTSLDELIKVANSLK